VLVTGASSRLVHLVNETDDVVAEDLQQQFIPLRRGCLAPQRVPELALQAAERRFDVRPPMIAGEKFVPVHFEEVERFVPQARLGSADRIRTERQV
jgi:hypothetical protein